MSNLRWILLFAGFAILLLLYFSGRPRKEPAYDGQGQRDPDDVENRMGNGNAGLLPAGATELPHGRYQEGFEDNSYQTDPLLDARSDPMHAGAPGAGQYDAGYAQSPDMHQSMGQQYGGQAGQQYMDSTDGFANMDPADMVRPGGGYHDNAVPASDGSHYNDQYAGQNTGPYNGVDSHYGIPAEAQQHYVEEPVYDAPAVAAVEAPLAPAPAPSSLGSKLDALSARFTGRNKKAAAANKDSAGGESDNPMVILLHVAAPEGQMIDGQLLLQVFEQRRYHFGEKNIFHSMHQGQAVFSIAKMVEPGFFDVNDISSFETPGLLLILQLPGPVAGEAAFEVLISEARELSDALGCRVLDSKRSTLSRQTTQHLREGVSNYVHRQKYLKKAGAS